MYSSFAVIYAWFMADWCLVGKMILHSEEKEDYLFSRGIDKSESVLEKISCWPLGMYLEVDFSKILQSLIELVLAVRILW